MNRNTASEEEMRVGNDICPKCFAAHPREFDCTIRFPPIGKEQVMSEGLKACDHCGLPIEECNALAMARKEVELWLRDAGGYTPLRARERAAELIPARTPAPSSSPDVADLVEKVRKFLPVSWEHELDGHGEPTHANLTFGEHQTQAMTLWPDDWMALNELPDALEQMQRRVEALREALEYAKEHLCGLHEAGALAEVQRLEARAALGDGAV